MDTAISPTHGDIPLLPTPSTSSASPGVDLLSPRDYETLSSSAHTSPDESRTPTSVDLKVPCSRTSGNIADSLDSLPYQHNQTVKRQRGISAVVYESQISPELEGIKLKIKKSPTQDLSNTAISTAATQQGKRKYNKTRTVGFVEAEGRKPSGRGRRAGVGPARKRRKKKGQDEWSDEEEPPSESEKVQSVSQRNGVTSEKDEMIENPAVQSMWGSDSMPAEILTKIFLEVTYTEGCVPTLVR
jgi:hypothetical protein